MTSYPTYRWVLICLYLMSNVSAQMVINTLGILLPSITASLDLSPSEQGLLGSAPFWSTIALAIPIAWGGVPPVAEVADADHPGGMRTVPVPAGMGAGVRAPAAGAPAVRNIHHRAAAGAGAVDATVVPATRGGAGQRAFQCVLRPGGWRGDWHCLP